MDAVTVESPAVQTQDGYKVKVTSFSTSSESRPVVVIAPAMGASQGFYHPLGMWLAEKGWRVICFDYRGLEKEARVHARMQHSIRTWAEQDANAVLNFAHELAQGNELVWFGHSLGCQLPGAMPDRHKISRIAGAATGTGYWLRGDLSLLPKAMLLWFFLVPVLTPLFGYFPGKRMNVVTDLPKNVIWQWRRWCLNRDYVAGAEGQAVKEQYDQMKIPLDILTFTDDELMSRKNSEDLYRLYPNSVGVHHRTSPAKLGLKKIGHFGFFKRKHQVDLWPLMYEKLFEKN